LRVQVEREARTMTNEKAIEEKEDGGTKGVQHCVMPYANFSDKQLKMIASSDSSTLCNYLDAETVFDGDRVAKCLAIANIAAAEELKRRAKA
jgi:hypothetical protein